MKKFGLRALAGGLALLMVAGLGAPAVAKAQDDLLILAPNQGLKILEITKDMVDEDGEIVISGGEYDRIVISKDVDAKDIYFDQVAVKDLVVESGNKATVQLWEVDAEKLTVQEPEVEEIPLEVLLPLLADELTYQIAMDMYHANKAYVENALKTAPSIVTMEDAKVDSLVVRANAKLDLAEGDVAVVALEASDKIERAKVTLKNYEGDVTYKGSENFNSMTLQNVDSRINNLKVDESYGSNYFTVTAKDSVVLNAEVAGNAQVTLNAPMGTVEISEAASAAKVTFLNAADELKVSADDAKIELTQNATVANAEISGDNVRVEGDGLLDAAEITGSGAYVSTFGTAVEGENTYVPPAAPVLPGTITDIDLVAAGDVTITKNADGSANVYSEKQYQSATFYVPEGIDVSKLKSIKVSIESDRQCCIKVLDTNGTCLNDLSGYGGDFPNWGVTEMTAYSVTYPIDASKNTVKQLDFMTSTTDPTNILVKSIVFVLKEDNGEEEAPLPDTVTYTYSDVTAKEGQGFAATLTENTDGTVSISFPSQYASAGFVLPEALNTETYAYVKVDGTASGSIALKVWKVGEVAETGNPTVTKYGYTLGEALSLSTIFGEEVDRVDITSMDEGTTTATITSITFAKSADLLAGGNTGGGNEGEVAPEGGILCTPDSTNLVEFTDVDFSELVGKTVNISVDVIRVGGTENPKAHGQFNDSVKAGDSDWFYAIHYNKEIGDEWTSFGATDFVVPEQFGDETNPVYFAIKAASGVDYSQYKIYYKNFKVVVDGEEEVPEGGTLCTPDNTNLVEFTDVDFSELVGKTVNISVDVIRVGGTENPKAHGQFNDSVKAGDSDWFYAIHYNKEIGDTWTSFGKTEFVVPEQFGDETNPVYFAIKVASGTDYSPYKIYYKNFNVEVIEEEKVTEFYVAKDVAFNDVEVINSNGNIVAQLEALNLAGDNLVNTLPAALAGEATSYKTLEGIMSKIDYFEFSVILTEGTPKEGLQDGIYWAPQAQIQAQSTNYDEGTWNLGLTQEQNATLCVNLGQATESAPKTGSGKLYTEYFEGWTSKDQYSLNMLQIQFLNAELGTFVSGTYSIKAVLK